MEKNEIDAIWTSACDAISDRIKATYGSVHSESAFERGRTSALQEVSAIAAEMRRPDAAPAPTQIPVLGCDVCNHAMDPEWMCCPYCGSRSTPSEMDDDAAPARPDVSVEDVAEALQHLDFLESLTGVHPYRIAKIRAVIALLEPQRKEQGNG